VKWGNKKRPYLEGVTLQKERKKKKKKEKLQKRTGRGGNGGGRAGGLKIVKMGAGPTTNREGGERVTKTDVIVGHREGLEYDLVKDAGDE